MAMNAGLYRIQSMRLADIGGSYWSPKPVDSFRTKLVWLPVVAIVGLGAWMVPSRIPDNNANSAPAAKVDFATAAPIQPSGTSPALDASRFNAAAAPMEAAAVEALKISSQSWR